MGPVQLTAFERLVESTLAGVLSVVTSSAQQNYKICMRSLALFVCAGVVSSAAATPMDVIKTRRQVFFLRISCTSEFYAESSHNLCLFSQAKPNEYKTIQHTISRILAEESPTAFFKGVVPRVLIISPLFGIAMMTYETLLATFP